MTPTHAQVPPASVLDRLRAGTRELHARVERRVDLPRRCGSIERYVRLLGRMLGLYVPLEARLASLDWTGTGIDLEERRRAHLLRADLEALGALADAPALAEPPELRSIAAGFGCMYVVEGSTLGGRVILRHVSRELGVSAASGASFFASHEDRVAAMWRAFCEAAGAHCTTEERALEALSAAEATFLVFERWLAEAELREAS